MCTKHQSVKELRHAGSEGKRKHQKSQTRATKKHKPKNHKHQTKTATTPLPFAASETGETGETETTPSRKQLVQNCCEEADILHQREWDHTNESLTIADERQVP